MVVGRWRSLLFVPGDRPERIAGAPRRGADAVVIDMEDAVAPDAKDVARALVVDLLQGGLPRPILVRVNAASSGELVRDVAALGQVLGRVDAVLLPKVSGPGDIARLEQLIGDAASRTAGDGLRIVPIVETAEGVLEARATAAASGSVAALLFGPADLSAELGVTPTPAGGELAHARAQVVLASAAAGIAAPIDGPHLVLGDPAGLAQSARAARALGFGGKAVIHPEQIPVVHAEFSVSAEDLAWAQKVTATFAEAEAIGSGVARLPDGTFVDEPVVRRARALLAQAAATTGPSMPTGSLT